MDRGVSVLHEVIESFCLCHWKPQTLCHGEAVISLPASIVSALPFLGQGNPYLKTMLHREKWHRWLKSHEETRGDLLPTPRANLASWMRCQSSGVSYTWQQVVVVLGSRELWGDSAPRQVWAFRPIRMARLPKKQHLSDANRPPALRRSRAESVLLP